MPAMPAAIAADLTRMRCDEIPVPDPEHRAETERKRCRNSAKPQ